MVGYAEFDWDEVFPNPKTEADFATLRLLGRITVGKTFALRYGRASNLAPRPNSLASSKRRRRHHRIR